jgi:hypothetical protein
MQSLLSEYWLKKRKIYDFAENDNGELSDAEMDMVAGGKSDKAKSILMSILTPFYPSAACFGYFPEN